MKSIATALFTLGLLSLATLCAAQPRIVASIKPVHSLVAGVMDGVTEPTLLIEGVTSPHDYSLRPSDMRSLTRAEVIFWVSEELESVLVKPIANIASVRSVELLSTPDLTRLSIRRGGTWQVHEPAGEHDGHHEHGTLDTHIWLDPRNAMALVERIASVLMQEDPEHAGRYRRNARDLIRRLERLDRELAAQLAPVAQVPYFVFHDAYQYFENRYGLNARGAITLDPDRLPGARRVKAIRDHIRTGGARCVFSEPQFQADLVSTLVAGTDTRTGVLDPLGTELKAGQDAYFRLMRNLAAALERCLSG